MINHFKAICYPLVGLYCGYIISKIYCSILYDTYKCKQITSPKYYITGDKHRDFKHLIRFCKKNRTTIKDTMIILGDAGFNYFGDKKDNILKKKLSAIHITLFCIYGNKENRPQNIKSYVTKKFHGGIVYYEEQYPNILFSKDCEVYQFNGKSAIVVGGAHSVDKLFRIDNGYPWWNDEEPSSETKKLFEYILRNRNNRIDYIFTHTAPLKYGPNEMFISNGNNKKSEFVPDIDKTTEQWLDSIEEKVTYTKWFCGHYHTDKSVDRMEIMFNDIKTL